MRTSKSERRLGLVLLEKETTDPSYKSNQSDFWGAEPEHRVCLPLKQEILYSGDGIIFIASSPNKSPSLLEARLSHLRDKDNDPYHLHGISRQKIAHLRNDALNTGINTRVTFLIRALLLTHMEWPPIKSFLSLSTSVFSSVKWTAWAEWFRYC